MRHLLVLSLVLLMMNLFAVVALAQPPAAARVYSCAELKQAPIPNTTITLAQAQPASTNPPAPAHCEIVGKINERVGQDGKPYAIGFRLRLPVDWNGRFFFQGGGGLDGSVGNALGAVGIGQADNAISRGYAVVSTDAGHTSETAPVIGGALFGFDPQARVDYGYNALDVVTRTSKRIIELRYGRPPRYSYFIGCSNGGRQGMVASQRFPRYFDGIVAGNPGFNLPKAAVAEAWDSQAFAVAATQLDVGGRQYLPTTFSFTDLTLVANAVLKRCDDLDGLEDGMINNLPACRFDPVELQCQGDKDDTCLSLRQVAALRAVFCGARNSRGRLLYSTWPYDAGVGAPGWRVWKIGFPAPPGAPPVNNAINLTLGATALPYVFVTPPDAISANDPVRYMLNFNIPGMNHCGGGPATDVADFLTPLVEWVERGKAPDEIVGAANSGSPWPGRTRPLCPYPKQARYKGSGDINDAANFRCETPEPQ